MPTVLLYWQVFRNAQSKQERLFSKKLFKGENIFNRIRTRFRKMIAKELLGQVLNRMPDTWLDNLDKTIADHLAEH